MRVAVIPARGGSQRIPRKNIRLFNGKPIIVRSIEAAKLSACFDRILVSTDDEEIAEISIKHGAEVPFLRPPELADNHTNIGKVMSDVVTKITTPSFSPTSFCCIFATAPLISPIDLIRGMEALEANDIDYAFSATRFRFPIQRAFRLTETKRVEMFNPEHLLTRSQDLEIAYHDAGQFYWGTPTAFAQEHPIFSLSSTPIEIPAYRVQDIDSEEDWKTAEILFEVLRITEDI